jgi:hypothetical protein
VVIEQNLALGLLKKIVSTLKSAFLFCVYVVKVRVNLGISMAILRWFSGKSLLYGFKT